MDMIPLKASARDEAKTPKQIRRDKQVPCVVYGNVENGIHAQCLQRDLSKAFHQAGESTLVELDFDGKKIPVLFKDIQFHPVSGMEMHADFYAVNMREEIETTVPLEFEGEAPAVKDLGGIFVTAQDSVTVSCLPANLPHALTVDISKLAEFGDVITIADIVLPKGVTITDDAEAVVATVQEPREDEPETVVEAAVPAEGAAAPAAEGAEGEKKE